MSSRIHMLGFLALVVSAICSPALAGGIKYHQLLELNGVHDAEFTYISNNAEPRTERLLYRDAAGAHIVIRNTTLKAPAEGQPRCTASIELVSTAEVLRMVIGNGNVTVSLGENSFTYNENDDGTAQVRNAGNQLIASASPEFKQALRRLALIGARETSVAFYSYMLRSFLYSDINTGGLRATESESTAVVRDFDPSTTPPGPFEQAFGSAYYD